jgi:hypothetical protein
MPTANSVMWLAESSSFTYATPTNIRQSGKSRSIWTSRVGTTHNDEGTLIFPVHSIEYPDFTANIRIQQLCINCRYISVGNVRYFVIEGVPRHPMVCNIDLQIRGRLPV